MNLKLFFTPPQVDFELPGNALGNAFVTPQDEGFDLSKMNLALLGINTSDEADLIRTKLYALKRSNATYCMADLGNLQTGNNPQQTRDQIRKVVEFLLAKKVIPVIIGGHHELAWGQYLGYESANKLISVMNVDAFLDVETEKAESNQFLDSLLTHRPNYLFSYSHLAHQTYLIDPAALDALEKLYFESMRLGELRNNIELAEPLIRLADMMSFDISAIRSSDAPGNPKAQPFGLTGEEACQLCWYAGMNEKLSSIGFHEYHPNLDDEVLKTASVMATMVWYFIDGVYNRKDSGKFDSGDYLKYVVSMEGTNDVLEFYKSKLSDKWWMAVTYGENHAQRAIIPCSYQDYTAATHGDFPERWIIAQGKLV